VREVKINGIYKHFKGGYYLVVDIANHSETMDMFLSEVSKNGQKYRFALQEIKSIPED